MKKRLIAMASALAVMAVMGSTSAAFAAEFETAEAQPAENDTSAYSYNTGRVNGARFADSEDIADKADYSYIAGRARGSLYAESEGAAEDADKTEFSFNAGRTCGSKYAQDGESDEFQSMKSGYSFSAGRQSNAE